ncbi:hypothetical protein AAFF_G00242510 [Aldrovandia affinis]|uniref:Uncharacterized protein n=1 Tax=Aldrovandia affinis TaxID=143900 RepID=A0AAD7RDS6_9TELE|nr:hypothetical protein AAFF_G00242510 [Aldrovandia affinis]
MGYPAAASCLSVGSSHVTQLWKQRHHRISYQRRNSNYNGRNHGGQGPCIHTLDFQESKQESQPDKAPGLGPATKGAHQPVSHEVAAVDSAQPHQHPAQKAGEERKGEWPSQPLLFPCRGRRGRTRATDARRCLRSAIRGGAPATASGASLHYGFFSSPSLANGLRSPEDRLHRRPRIGARRRRQTEQLEQLGQLEQLEQPEQSEYPQQLEGLPQTRPDQQMQGQVNTDSSLADQPSTVPPEVLTGAPRPEAYSTSTQSCAPPYYPSTPHNPPERDLDAQACPVPRASPPTPAPIPNPILAPSPVPIPVEGERKYALRSSGRPRFPCRLRKSSRLRRTMEDEEKGDGEEARDEEKIWKGEGLGVGPGEESLLPEGASMSCELQPASQAPVLDGIETPAPEPTRQVPSPPSSRGRRKGRCVGVRKIVVKVARIPVSLSRRQKTYKISSSQGSRTPVRPEPTPLAPGSPKNSAAPAAGQAPLPTALLCVRHQRREGRIRGRPVQAGLPEQAAPGYRTLLTAPLLDPQRARILPRPPREPWDLDAAAQTHRVPSQGGPCRLHGRSRRGVAGSSEAFKSSFSDFFETIGKKRKVPPSEPGQPRKRGKGAAAALNKAAVMGAELGGLAVGEKPVRKRRSRKNGILKSGQGQQEQDGANGGSNWGVKGGGREGLNDRERGPGYQGCTSPRGGFASCDMGKGGFYPSPGASGGGGGGDEAQGLFAGYFRSLLDSDDSSDLLDISLSSPASRSDSRKLGPGYESSSPAPGQRWSPAFPKRTPKGLSPASDGPQQPQSSTSARPQYSYSLSQTSPTTSFPKSAPPTLSLSRSPSSPHPSSSSFPQYPSSYSSGQPAGGGSTNPQQQRLSDCSYSYGAGLSSSKANSTSPAGQCHMGFSSYQTAQAKRGYSGYPGSTHSASMRGEAGPLTGPASPGGSYMAMAKSPFPSSSPPESCRQYPIQWGYRQGYQSWGTDNFGPNQYHGYNDYGTSGSNESKDILDISNYTPQKAKQRSFSETFSESSSDSSHLGPTGPGMGGGGSGGYRPRDNLPSGEVQSSLSSLEKLMLDWHESSAGSSYNWSQNVLFQGGSKPGRGRRKRGEPQGDREGCPLSFPPASPTSSPSPGPGSKRSPMAARQSRGPRGRGGFSSCQRERAPSGKPKAQKSPVPAAQAGGSGLYQDTLDYYSGDSSSLSPLPSQQQGFSMEVCEYSSPYSVHPSTPSSDERFAQIFPGETASLSPSISLQPDILKPYPKPSHPPTYSAPSRTFSPSCSPTPRLLPSCSAAHSPHRAPNKDFSQYDSPSYCGSPCWYGQGGSLAGSPHSYEAERPPVSTLPPHARTEKRDLGQWALIRRSLRTWVFPCTPTVTPPCPSDMPPSHPGWRAMPVARPARRRRVHRHQPVGCTIVLSGGGHRCNQSCFFRFVNFF